MSIPAPLSPGRLPGNEISDIRLLRVTVEISGNSAISRLSSTLSPWGYQLGRAL